MLNKLILIPLDLDDYKIKIEAILLELVLVNIHDPN